VRKKTLDHSRTYNIGIIARGEGRGDVMYWGGWKAAAAGAAHAERTCGVSLRGNQLSGSSSNRGSH